MPDSKAILFLDADNVLWYKAKGKEKEKISSNVTSFDFCKDESTISFITVNDDNVDSPAELYIKKMDSEKEKIASDLAHYSDLSYSTFMSDNGDVIFWKDKDNSLYKKEGINEKEKISANADSFSVKNNGASYTYSTPENCYIKWINNIEIQKITDESIYSGDISLCDNGMFAVFISSRNYKNDMSVGELYMVISGGEMMRIASDIQNFKLSADGSSLYYLNDENEVYLKKLPEVTEKSAENQSAFQEKLNETEKIKLCTDVVEYKLSADGKNSAFIDKDKNLYVCYSQKEKVRFASDVESFSIFPEMLVYKTAEGKLVMNSALSDRENIQTNNKTLSENAAAFQTSRYGKYIVFSTDEDKVMICADGQAPVSIFAEANEFDIVNYNGTCIYDMYISDTQVLYATPDYNNPTTYTYRNSGKKTILDYQISQDGKLWLKVSGSDDGKYDCFWVPES